MLTAAMGLDKRSPDQDVCPPCSGEREESRCHRQQEAFGYEQLPRFFETEWLWFGPEEAAREILSTVLC